MNLITWPPSLADCWLKPPWKPHVNEGLCDALNAISSVWSHYGGFHSQLAAPQSSLDIRRETTARQTYGKYGFCDVCSCSDGGKKKDRFIKVQFISGVLKVNFLFFYFYSSVRDRNMYPCARWKYHIIQRGGKMLRHTVITASSGCIFCNQSIFQVYFRSHSYRFRLCTFSHITAAFIVKSNFMAGW